MKKPTRFGQYTVDLVYPLETLYALGNEGKVAIAAYERSRKSKVPETHQSPPQKAWEITLDACIDNAGNLMGRLGKLWPCGDLLLVQTCGEHWRGATHHAFKLHAVNTQGKLRWCLPVSPAPVPLRQQHENGADTILILDQYYQHAPRASETQTLYRLISICTKTGNRLQCEDLTWFTHNHLKELETTLQNTYLSARLKPCKGSHEVSIEINVFPNKRAPLHLHRTFSPNNLAPYSSASESES